MRKAIVRKARAKIKSLLSKAAKFARGLRGRMAAAKNWLFGRQNRYQLLNRMDSANYTRYAQLSVMLESTLDALQGLQKDIAAVRQQAAEKTVRIDGQIGDLLNRSATIQGQVGTIQGQVGTIQGQVGTIQTSINSVQDTVARQKNSLLAGLNQHYSRNTLPNDQSSLQRNLVANWQAARPARLASKELMDAGFRVYSQNDEDGLLLRLFAQIGTTNRCVIEIGSNCSGSDLAIPENLSANLVINNGWHGIVFDIDQAECSKMQYFFANEFATRHFHVELDNTNQYYSPRIVQAAVDPGNINEVLRQHCPIADIDLMIVDIDGGDYEVVLNLDYVKPRVLVVEFEKRFRERHSVKQTRKEDFSRRWAQSGSVSLPAWVKLLSKRGYSLCAINSTGFNAFFVRTEIVKNSLEVLDACAAFNAVPAFSCVRPDFWLEPDETWEKV
jgi:hypothetical protein